MTPNAPRMYRKIAAIIFLAACAQPTHAPAPTTYVAGQSYFGVNNYLEYVAGNTPVILTAPHGGALLPPSIPDRVAANCGGAATTVTDLNTIELARAMQQRWFARFGKYPHVVINHLARRKFDPNRTEDEAACNNAEATKAFAEWHAFIDAAKSAAVASSGKAWYMDMHGHGHAKQRLELGYLLTTAQLELADLDPFENSASVRAISLVSPLSFTDLLRGPNSLGTLYAENGFPAIPSASDPRPNGDTYFSGGDNTRQHTCSTVGTNANVCGVQIESNFTGVRDTPASRDRFGDATAIVLERYLSAHWGLKP